MVKGAGKSSASSGTRKKHARRAAGPTLADDPLPKEKKIKSKDKSKNKEPRQKVFIPPVKPAPVLPDPLDTLGLAHKLPPDLLVVLRSLSKKATVTKIRALEELQSTWVDGCRRNDDKTSVSILVDMLPVWFHHISALFVHPSRRIRLLTAGLHLSFLQLPVTRDHIFWFIRDTASTDQLESVLGSWCMASHDIDRAVSNYASKSWNQVFSLPGDDTPDKLILNNYFLPHLLSFTQQAVLDPLGVYMYLNPIAPTSAAPTPPKRMPGRSAPAVAIRRQDVEQSPRTKSDELEENDQDRQARLRVGAFGALKWVLDRVKLSLTDGFAKLFANPALWSSLCHAEFLPPMDLESFGYNQPSVRKSAWSLVQSLLRYRKDAIEAFLPILSTAILRSAWVEPDTNVHSVMWQPLLTFLKEFPNAWDLEALYDIEEAEDSDSDGEGQTSEAKPRTPSSAYRDFLRFLELGCSGSPITGYPTVVIILSTIPSSVLASSPNPLSTIFTSFWAAIDGRAFGSLQRSATSAAFLSALLECMVFLIKRLRNDTRNHASLLRGEDFGGEGENGEAMAAELVRGQFTRMWEELVEKRLKMEEKTAAGLIARTLETLHQIDGSLFHAAWNPLTQAIPAASLKAPGLVSVVLRVFDDYFQEGTEPKVAVHALIAQILQVSATRCDETLNLALNRLTDESPKNNLLLVTMLDTFEEGLFVDQAFSVRIDATVKAHAYTLLSTDPDLLIAYLSHRQQQDQCLQIWRILLSSVSNHPADAIKTLTPLLDGAQKGLLPQYLKPKSDELNELTGKLLADGLGGSAHSVTFLSLVRQILQFSSYFLAENGFRALIQSIVSAFSLEVDDALLDDGTPSLSFEASLDLLHQVFQRQVDLLSRTEVSRPLMLRVFFLGYLLPICFDSLNPRGVAVARSIWALWLAHSSIDHQDQIQSEIKSRLQSFVLDTETRPSPENILRMASVGCPGLHINVLVDIFPPSVEIDNMLDLLSPNPIDPSLAALDPLIPPTSVFQNRTRSQHAFDSRGYAPYVRVVSALLHVFVQDRHAAKENLWALRHFLALAIYIEDFLRVPSDESEIFRPTSARETLSADLEKVRQITAYLFTSLGDGDWRLKVVTAINDPKSRAASEDAPRFLMELIRYSEKLDTIRESRILYNALEHMFDNLNKAEADLWILYARKMEKTAPLTSMAIVSAVTHSASEPPRLDRYRNELAAALLGISVEKANTEGLLLLRKLAATAPPPESDVIFLPQPRAVNVMKACQQWIASDEDLDEEVESAMTLIFLHLAPILQDIPGAHWDLIFDVIESNLENCSLTDDSMLVSLGRTLDLIIAIEELSSRNKTLRADWHQRQKPILSLVLDLAATHLVSDGISAPRSACRELVLSIIQDLPESLIDETTLPRMSHLLIDPSIDVQKMAYHFLHGAAKKRTEHLVIEAGVESEALTVAELPSELIDILQRNLNQLETSQLEEQALFGYLLGWMVLFDLFIDASFKVRSSYIDQLRNLDILATHFLPYIIHILNLDEGIVQAFKLDIWSIEEYYLDLYQPGTSFSIQLFAAHLYYRALLTIPSLIHTWISACKDRQLSTSIVNYTSQHFSPVIILKELAHVKNPEATDGLIDENLSIKVSGAVNEVTAAYLVDEHQLEIKLKIPPDWPLHKIEIKDLKRVGVDESRWRSWILAVQQTIWAHNGHIADGLSLFKKNVTLHFEGQVECAICYSIISVMDGSLPKKPCKTCKNRFHAGCLYKWFSSSHSSSCPLCRSNIF